MRTLACVVVAVLLLSAPAANAMGFGSGPDLWGGLDMKPVVGRWAEYQMAGEGGKPMTMRMSVVGQEDDYFWFETVMSDDEGEKMISKMLVSADPKNEDNLKRMIVKSGSDPAMEMPIQSMHGMSVPDPEIEVPETVSADLGVESVTVPAGTFEAHHWRFTSGDMVSDVWVKADVGPYGVVKSMANDVAMVLIAHGDGATSLITETPQSLPMHGFPMPGMGGN